MAEVDLRPRQERTVAPLKRTGSLFGSCGDHDLRAQNRTEQNSSLSNVLRTSSGNVHDR